MSVVPIANQAGSAGKTTTAVTLAAMLAAEGHTVRLVDLDAQANATYWLGVDQAERTIGHVLLRECTIDDASMKTSIEGLALVPAGPDVDQVVARLGAELGAEQRLRLALETAADVDVTIIDCPGSLGLLTVSAFVAATGGVITVTQPSVKELAGIPKVEDTIAAINAAYNPKLFLGAVVPCIVPPTTAGIAYTEAIKLLEDAYPELTTPGARRTKYAVESYAQQEPLSLYAPKAALTEDYQVILADLTEREIW